MFNEWDNVGALVHLRVDKVAKMLQLRALATADMRMHEGTSSIFHFYIFWDLIGLGSNLNHCSPCQW